MAPDSNPKSSDSSSLDAFGMRGRVSDTDDAWPDSQFMANGRAYQLIFCSSEDLLLQGGGTEGSMITLERLTGLPIQHWIVVPVLGEIGAYRISNRASGLAMKATPTDGPNGNVRLWPWTGADDQLWSCRRHGSAEFKVSNVSCGLLLERAEDSAEPGDALTLGPEIPGDNSRQRWLILQIVT